MGEHQDDLTVEEMIEMENIRRAKLIVEQELNMWVELAMKNDNDSEFGYSGRMSNIWNRWCMDDASIHSFILFICLFIYLFIYFSGCFNRK